VPMTIEPLSAVPAAHCKKQNGRTGR